MSLKDKFIVNSGKVLEKTSNKDIVAEIESENYQVELYEEKNRFIPHIDFTKPANFAKFGSAEKYYYDAIASVYGTYPYDGSLYEKLKWHNTNPNIANYVFDNLYPRNNGYINIGLNYGTDISVIDDYSLTSNPEYIFFKGGPNASDRPTLRTKFDKANKLEPTNNRTYNLYLNGQDGFTTEFWFKKDDNLGSTRQVIFDLWNSSSFGNSYGRFRIEIDCNSLNEFIVVLRSGSEGTDLSGISIGDNLDFQNNSWNHYALNIINSGSSLKLDLYKNGQLNYSTIAGTAISEVTGAYIATLGSLITQHTTASLTGLGYGKLSGSLDEFRFWKSKRTDKKIKRFWFTQVGGGTNTDEANNVITFIKSKI